MHTGMYPHLLLEEAEVKSISCYYLILFSVYLSNISAVRTQLYTSYSLWDQKLVHMRNRSIRCTCENVSVISKLSHQGIWH